MESVSEDVRSFTKGCECLLAAVAVHTRFSELERQMIDYYYQELMNHVQALRTEEEHLSAVRGEVKVKGGTD